MRATEATVFELLPAAQAERKATLDALTPTRPRLYAHPPALCDAPAGQPGRPEPESLGVAPDAVVTAGTPAGSPRVPGLGCNEPWPVPTRTRAREQARTGPSDSDYQERTGEALDQEIPSDNKIYLANRPSTRHTQTVDAKASPSGAGAAPFE